MGVPAASFTVDNETQITAVVPSSAASGPIQVTTPHGVATSESRFTYIPPVTAPTISGFSPASVGIGTSVVIVGTYFTGATAVRFNGTPAASFSVDSATQITAIVPAGVSSGTIQVITPDGTATSADGFIFVPQPAITAFSPTSGGRGASVTITGTNLSGTTAVYFILTKAGKEWENYQTHLEKAKSGAATWAELVKNRDNAGFVKNRKRLKTSTGKD